MNHITKLYILLQYIQKDFVNFWIARKCQIIQTLDVQASSRFIIIVRENLDAWKLLKVCYEPRRKTRAHNI